MAERDRPVLIDLNSAKVAGDQVKEVAQRIAFHLLSGRTNRIVLTGVLAKVRDGVRFCAVCGNVSARVQNLL